ncbi:phosphatidylinositol 3 and 4-kinase-domain-containing protein [Amylostereum chailletii]|nr:phosphatidylinositol 3 and 4-kinase-domain-containing protein [Amylostereum chailletii]
MPSRSEYQPLPQAAEEEDVDDLPADDIVASPARQPRTEGRLRRSNHPGSIDLRKLDTAFKRWTESIAQKMKRKKKKEEVHGRKEILRSVFDPPVFGSSTPAGPVKTLDHKPPMSQADFDAVVQSVKQAISEGIHPKMITKGSSGSYFARAKSEGRVQTVAVFKPKDEEPYGRLNPKTTKWLHRQLRWIIPFGRACLIPNLSYISEAAASLLDRRLNLHIVPRTELVSLSSQAFFYDWIDRTNFKKGKPLPDKIGSMQYFLHGFQDASDFLRKHPWPGRSITDTFDDSTHRTGTLSKKFMSAFKIVCGRTGAEEDVYDEAEAEDDRVLYDASENHDSTRPFYWSGALQRSFREELEKLVILDYLMLNTDRGADNYMIKYCEAEHEKSLVDVAPSRQLEMPMMSEVRRSATPPNLNPGVSFASPPRINRASSAQGNYTKHPHIHIAAIDNSLSFPHEHPHGWRSYTFGWLYLPVTVIGRPFSQKTRDHFLPLLTSKEWWEETTYQLRKLFAVDPDFHPKMFGRQLAVIKGQAWNIVQSLRHEDEGPLELTRRTSALVHDDDMQINDDATAELLHGPLSASITSLPVPSRPQRNRSRSNSSDFPPPMRRMSIDSTGAVRPVPFSAKFQRVHPGTTGVTVLEHMERLDAVKASLERLVVDDQNPNSDAEEQDMGESSQPRAVPGGAKFSPPDSLVGPSSTPSRAAVTELEPVPEGDSSSSIDKDLDDDAEDAEEDLAALSKSLSHLDGTTSAHGRFHSHAEECGLDWMQEPAKKRTVISERLELVHKKPLFSWC